MKHNLNLLIKNKNKQKASCKQGGAGCTRLCLKKDNNKKNILKRGEIDYRGDCFVSVVRCDSLTSSI